MIISNIIGGLGNQMFQYAAGLALARTRGSSIQLATDMFHSYRLHNGFELERVFRISAPTATRKDLKSVIGWRSPQRIRRILASFPALGVARGPHFLTEADLPAADVVAAPSTSTYLHGYWQSERYFGQYADGVRAAFCFAEDAVGQNAEVLTRITQQQSTSVHMRRGDYLSAKNASLYNQCDEAYYMRCLHHVLEKAGHCKFFVFSDDPQWAKEFFASTSFEHEIVDHNRGAASYNDMRLMSACDNHVIANSTFSWWGAWLDPRPEKLVIAPVRWMKVDDLAVDIVPASWVRL